MLVFFDSTADKPIKRVERGRAFDVVQSNFKVKLRSSWYETVRTSQMSLEGACKVKRIVN